jgi:hypothetical protein
MSVLCHGSEMRDRMHGASPLFLQIGYSYYSILSLKKQAERYIFMLQTVYRRAFRDNTEYAEKRRRLYHQRPFGYLQRDSKGTVSLWKDST